MSTAKPPGRRRVAVLIGAVERPKVWSPRALVFGGFLRLPRNPATLPAQRAALVGYLVIRCDSSRRVCARLQKASNKCVLLQLEAWPAVRRARPDLATVEAYPATIAPLRDSALCRDLYASFHGQLAARRGVKSTIRPPASAPASVPARSKRAAGPNCARWKPRPGKREPKRASMYAVCRSGLYPLLTLSPHTTLQEHFYGKPGPCGKPVAKLRGLTTLHVRGGLDTPAVRCIVARHINELRYCARSRRATIDARFVIGNAGSVQRSSVKASVVAAKRGAKERARLQRCVVGALRRWLFPAAKKPPRPTRVALKLSISASR